MAISVCREKVSGTYGSGTTKNGVRIGHTRNEAIQHEHEKDRARRHRTENPATNDVHPVMKPASGPYASRR